MTPMRLLILDNHSDDAELIVRQISRGGYRCTWRRVETEQDFRTQLREFQPQLIVSDFSLPHYDGLSALTLAGVAAPSVPFIFVSGSTGEQRALQVLDRGATDYVCKRDLTQLLPAVTRVLTQPCDTPVREASSERVRRIAKALEMLSDMRDAARATQSRAELVTQVCRVVNQAQLYDYAFIALVDSHTHVAHAVAWVGTGAEHAYRAQFELALEGSSDTSAIGRVLRTGEAVLCLNLADYAGSLSDTERQVAAPASAFAVVPLVADRKTTGALTVGTAPGVAISDQEFLLLEQLARQVARAIQALPEEGNIRPVSIVDPLTRDEETLVQHAKTVLKTLRERRDVLPYPLIGGKAIDAHRRVLEHRVLLAARQQSFSINYQPVIERVSGQVTAVEALLRWHDAELGRVPPAVFLPVLERTGLIVPVGEWVLTQAAHDFGHWHALGLPPLRVAINISPVEFNRKGFVADFLQKTRHTVDPAYIDIEISEVAVHPNLKHLRNTLKILRGEGVRIAIDDFAMTRDGLSHLSELPVDSLKIDRSFVNDLTHLPESHSIVSSMIAVARTYGLRTTAEGVESVEQLEILDSLGCEQTQGYFHSPAVSAKQIERIFAGHFQ